MTEKCFVDTNIFFYAIDRDGSARHHEARLLLERLAEEPFFLSTQVLLELANITRLKLKMSGYDQLRALKLSPSARVLDTTADDVLDAVRLTQIASISIWDAMIVVSAAKAGCDTLYTEDLGHGQVIAGVRIVNPFTKESP